MLVELIRDGFGKTENYNCAEKIINGANFAYDIGLDVSACKLMAGFGGGMGIHDACGALTAGVAVLSSLFVENVAHESDRIKLLCGEFLNNYRTRMGSLNCEALMNEYRTPDEGCHGVVLVAAEELDKIVGRELNM